MHREEAIAQIKDHIRIHRLRELRAVYITDALDMAIQALEKLNAIETNKPDSEDWEHYADRLHDISYKSGYEQAQKDIADQEPCEDAISRQAMIDEFEKRTHIDWKSLKLLNPMLEVLDDLPPVSPARPKGKWIGHREHCENLGVMPSGLGAYEWCSNCDCGIDIIEWHRNNYNFCPNCGCRMEGEQE